MVYFLHDSRVTTKEEKNQRQLFTARPLDGKFEGDGLSLTVERGYSQEDVCMNLQDAREFAKWMVDHFGLPLNDNIEKEYT